MSATEVREFRVSPILPSESALMARARPMRPAETEEFVAGDARKRVEHCPSFRGNADKAPPAILQLPEEATGGAAGLARMPVGSAPDLNLPGC